MTNLHRKGLVLEIPVSQNPNSTLNEGTFVGSSVYDWLFECHGFLHNAILILASLAFVLYLAFKAKKSFRKLSNGRSSIMSAYYGSLWLFSLLNLAWSCLQVCGFLQFKVKWVFFILFIFLFLESQLHLWLWFWIPISLFYWNLNWVSKRVPNFMGLLLNYHFVCVSGFRVDIFHCFRFLMAFYVVGFPN